ncbi:MAG: ABC transporter ATP-binding protein, partial [Nakamurella sp.]
MSAQRSDGFSGDRPAERLRADALTIGYDARVISSGLSVEIPDNEFTVIIGPNACGKSTLLRALARMLSPSAGSVLLDGQEISSYPSKEVARRLGLLPQSSVAPDGITVADLVARGRYPHQRLLRQWSRKDEEIVAEALAATNVLDLADRGVDELSGGQRQRVWLAMALAQQTPILLLDEPTTYLDIAHQIEMLDLCADLHTKQKRTLVAVLHDLNHACRYATHLIAMRGG